MKKILFSCLLLSTGYYSAICQSKDSILSKRGTMHIVGVQANALVRQIFNVGGTSAATNNPYLLTYTALGKKSKWGFDVGAGYTLLNSLDTDGNTKRESNINELFFRAGIQRFIPLNKNFSSTLNFHVLYDLINNKSKSEENFGSQITERITNNNTVRYGFGPNIGLRYRISPRVFIGTEASYYFKLGNTKQDITVITKFTGFEQKTESKVDDDFNELRLNVPAVLYLMVRF